MTDGVKSWGRLVQNVNLGQSIKGSIKSGKQVYRSLSRITLRT